MGADIRQLYEDAKFIRNIRTFLEYENTIRENPDGPAAGDFEELRLEGVTFAYPGAEKPALKDVSMTVRAGEKIAIVGANGAGKTTFSKLLLRFYAPQSARLSIMGSRLLLIALRPIGKNSPPFSRIFSFSQLSLRRT